MGPGRLCATVSTRLFLQRSETMAASRSQVLNVTAYDRFPGCGHVPGESPSGGCWLVASRFKHSLHNAVAIKSRPGFDLQSRLDLFLIGISLWSTCRLRADPTLKAYIRNQTTSWPNFGQPAILLCYRRPKSSRGDISQARPGWGECPGSISLSLPSKRRLDHSFRVLS